MNKSNPTEIIAAVRLIICMMSVFLGLLITVVSVPLIQGKVPMNGTYGVRIPKSFSSESNWYKLNAYGSKILVAFVAIPHVLFGVIAFFMPFRNIFEIMAAFFVVMILSISIATYLIFQFGKTLP
jgi:uncharacterized membrane protein